MLIKWQHTYDVYGIDDGIRLENKKTKLMLANSRTKISRKKAYLKTDGLEKWFLPLT